MIEFFFKVSISVLNEHKSLNGYPTTTITYCIDTDNLTETNHTFRSRGGDLTVPTSRNRSTSGSSTSSFKRLFRSSSKNNNKSDSTQDTKNLYSSIDNVLRDAENDRSLSRTRSLKVQNPIITKNNKLSVREHQPVQRSKSEHRRTNQMGSKSLLTQNRQMNTSNELSSNNNFLKPNLNSSRTNSNSGDINSHSSNNALSPKRPSFIKRMSLKLRKSKSMKKVEQNQVNEPSEQVLLDIEGII